MAMPKTGEYVISVHNKYGEKMKDLTTIEAGGLIASKEVGEALVASEKKAKSFSIDRRVFNSLDKG